jgi:hypothetical protein
MQKEIANGEYPDAASRAGASAAPNHAPAAKAHAVPSPYLAKGAGTGSSDDGDGFVTRFGINLGRARLLFPEKPSAGATTGRSER